jgi:hypothetical protein
MSKILLNIGLHKKTAYLAVSFFAFAPATLIFSPVISSEAVFNLLLMTALYCTMKPCSSVAQRYRNFSFASFCLGCLFLTRSTGLIFYVSILIYMFLKPNILLVPKVKRTYAWIAWVLPFALVLSWQLSFNINHYGRYSVSASTWSSFLLLTGTNRVSKGGFSRADADLVGFSGKHLLPPEEASAKALGLAKERISSDPVGFIKFALTDKIKRLWGTDAQSLYQAVATPSTFYMRYRRDFIQPILANIIDCFYLISLVLALGFIIRSARHQSWEFLTIAVLPMASLAFLHIFVEVQSRYHVPFMPYLYTFAASSTSFLTEKVHLCSAHKEPA